MKTNPQIILVMGVTGVGKSTFIKYATGCDVVVGHGQSSCEYGQIDAKDFRANHYVLQTGTAKVQCFQIPQTNFFLMDTPGFDDTHISDTQILREIAQALLDSFNDKAEIQGALYIHPVVEARMRGSGVKNLRMFKKVLGMNGMKNCRLVTTKWKLVEEAVGADREKELCESDDFWRPLVRAGATTVRFDDSTESAMNILGPLVFGPSFEPQLLGELRDGTTLPQTEAGQVVNDDVEEATKAHATELKELEKEKMEALAQKDFEYAAQLEEEKKKHQAKVDQLEKDRKMLDTPITSSGAGRFFARWVARAGVVVAGAVATYMSGGLLAPHAAMLYAATEQALQEDSKSCRRSGREPPRR